MGLFWSIGAGTALANDDKMQKLEERVKRLEAKEDS